MTAQVANKPEPKGKAKTIRSEPKAPGLTPLKSCVRTFYMR